MRNAEKLMSVSTGPTAKRNDPATSYQATESLHRAGRLSRQRRAVLYALRQNPNTTAAELAQRMADGQEGWPHRRLADLVRIGLASRGPYRLCRVTNQRCLTWRAIIIDRTLFDGGRP